jgi:hypothetical protein
MEGLGIAMSFSLECDHFKRTLKNPNLPDLAADVKIQEAQDLWIHRSIETPRTCRLLSDPVVQLDLGTRIMICQMQHTCTGKSLEACCSKKVLPHGLKRII